MSPIVGTEPRTATCGICGTGSNLPALRTREMMFGLRHEFAYDECSDCGCLTLSTVPTDLGPYYPPDYYSLRIAQPADEGRLRSWAKRRWTAHRLVRPNLAGRLAARLLTPPPFLEWARIAGTLPDDPVLDVGSGAGTKLLAMRSFGFTDLTGIDPFIDRDIRYSNGVRVFRRRIEQTEGQFGLIILDHSLEHMAEPVDVMHHVRRLLRPGGCALVRLPLADSHARAEYGGCWVQLDAPRHLVLHTRRSMESIAAAAGLGVTEVVYDSTAFQFWGSEQYRLDIPLRHESSHLTSPSTSPFTEAMIREWEREARSLNREERGDQACFYLRS